MSTQQQFLAQHVPSLKGIFAKNYEESFDTVRMNNAVAQQILTMEPKVECTANSMRLNIQDTPRMLLSVERGMYSTFFKILLFLFLNLPIKTVQPGKRLSPLPLSTLPSSCGYTIKAMQRDLVLVAPYDGCFVAVEVGPTLLKILGMESSTCIPVRFCFSAALQEDCYVLPLRLSGLPVKMSCPMMRPPSANTQTFTCHPEKIEVNLNWGLSSSEIQVKSKA